MKLQIIICDEERVLDQFTIEPGPRDKDVPTKIEFASRVQDYLSMRYEMESDDDA